ncbi:hypothetical protein TRAPUB_721 [Trametes pubescens]|uniref:Uncharacterized protein n=1 Tax=Trametes pubescens TaxID=154538 RepID=A0A1M2VLF9_TRAPU|nr:hypothetical protein TRAPUB_721 [Trametes pubescens]
MNRLVFVEELGSRENSDLDIQDIAPMVAVRVGEGPVGTEGLAAGRMLVVWKDWDAHIGSDPFHRVLFAQRWCDYIDFVPIPWFVWEWEFRFL